MKLHSAIRQLPCFNRKLNLSIRNLIKNEIEYRPFGEADLAYQSMTGKDNFELVDSLLELLEQYRKLLSDSRNFICKEQYIWNVKSQCNIFLQQLRQSNIKEFIKFHKIYNKYIKNTNEKPNQITKIYVENSTTHNKPQKQMMLKTVSPEKLEQRFPYAELPSKGDDMFELYKFLYQKEQIFKSEKDKQLRTKLLKWLINTPDFVLENIWNKICNGNVLSSNEFLNSVYKSNSVPPSQKIAYFLKYSDSQQMFFLFRTAVNIQQERQLKLEKLLNEINNNKSKMYRQYIKKIFESLTENSIENLKFEIKNHTEHNEAITKFIETLNTHQNIVDYWNNLSESNRIHILEILNKNSNNITNLRTKIKKHSEHNEALFGFADILSTHENIVEYWNNLSESNREQIIKILNNNSNNIINLKTETILLNANDIDVASYKNIPNKLTSETIEKRKQVYNTFLDPAIENKLKNLSYKSAVSENQKEYSDILPLEYVKNSGGSTTELTENVEECLSSLQRQLNQYRKELSEIKKKKSDFKISANQLKTIQDNIYNEIRQEAHDSLRRRGK